MKNLIFADTCYWIALLNPQDSLHLEAMTLTSKLGKVQVITTDEVLVEVLNFFSAILLRRDSLPRAASKESGFQPIFTATCPILGG